MSARRGHRRRGGRHEEEEHANHERWLLTYADMITLLMVLFIVLFAMSTVDAKKFEELKESLAGAFGGATHLVAGGSGVGGDTEGITPAPIDLSSSTGGSGVAPSAAAKAQDKAAADKAVQDKAVQAADRAKASQNQRAAQAELDRLLKLRKKMQDALRRAHLAGTVQFEINQRGLVVRIVTSAVVFGGDSAVLRPEGQRIVRALVPALRSVRNALEVSGHTNQLNVPTRAYPTSWELSTARASSVVRYLLGFRGMSAARMTAAGYADQRPLLPPSDPRSITRNRRVEVLVLSNEPAEVRALLPSLAKGK